MSLDDARSERGPGRLDSGKTVRKRKLTVALSGNPNSGKTTIFNNLTGSRQHVGNWPGVTVEKKEGSLRHGDTDFTIVDLPGTYSLTAYSLEEVIVRDYISVEKPDVVVNVIDASNLERNLYLTTQLMELGVPMIVALNMMDEAEENGFIIDLDLLSTLLGVPVVPMVGLRNKGTTDLKDMVLEVIQGTKTMRGITINYGAELEDELEKISGALDADPAFMEHIGDRYSSRWMAVKLLEDDERVENQVFAATSLDSNLPDLLDRSRRHLESILGEDTETIIVDMRYGFVAGIVREALVKTKPDDRMSRSDRIDNVLTHRIMGFPIFGLLMWLMFFLTFAVGEYPMGWIESLVGVLSDYLSDHVTIVWLKSLLVDGILAGVGGVIVFTPQIFIIYLCISLFEDTGYMSRAAFIMDRIMHHLGLHGKSFIPMLMGFGCNVPAIMATRTLENDKDRLLTILINPLMSCTARLPVYALLAGAFFAGNEGTVTFSLYIMGVILAVLLAKLFRRVFFPGPSEPFVMELPPYRVPTLKGTFVHMWDKGSLFIRKAGTIILAGSIFVWIISYFPKGIDGYGSAESWAGSIGRILEPLVKPLGFNWIAVVAILMGLIAKEVVVSTFGGILGAGADEVGIQAALRDREVFTPRTAYGFMAFTLLYTPCLATIAMIRKETGSRGWTAFAVGYSLVLAWVVAFIINQGGRLLGIT